VHFKEDVKFVKVCRKARHLTSSHGTAYCIFYPRLFVIYARYCTKLHFLLLFPMFSCWR